MKAAVIRLPENSGNTSRVKAQPRQLLSRTDVDEHATRATFAFFPETRQPPPISPQPLTVRATLPSPRDFYLRRKCNRGKSRQAEGLQSLPIYRPSLITFSNW